MVSLKSLNKNYVIIALAVIILILLVTNAFKSEQISCKVIEQTYTKEYNDCDSDPHCGCDKRSWFGFGPCVRCNCLRYVNDC